MGRGEQPCLRRHPEQGGWTARRDRATGARSRGSTQRASSCTTTLTTGRLAGFVWTKVHDDEQPRLGEIYVIAVDPDFGGRKLGRALTLAGLDWMHRDRGVDHGMLYVDAANEPAVRLYTSIGFTVDHTDRAYAGAV